MLEDDQWPAQLLHNIDYLGGSYLLPVPKGFYQKPCLSAGVKSGKFWR